MALPVAIQSAIFYVVACTPCLSARTRYRTKKQFDKERKERAALEMDEPQQYRHPSPFNMNPYWEEEMRMGPSLPKKGRPGKQLRQRRERQQREQRMMQNSSQRNLTSAGQDSYLSSPGRERGRSRGDSDSSGPLGGILVEALINAPNAPNAPPSTDGPAGSGSENNTPASLDRKASGANNNDTNNAGSSAPAPAPASANVSQLQAPSTIAAAPKLAASPTLVAEDDTHSIINSMPNTSMSVLEATPSMTVGSDTLSENWNHKRYQREDEELWGDDTSSRTHKLMDAIAKASSSAGRLIESARLGTKELRMNGPPLVPGGASTTTTITDQDRANFYAPTFIHPPVNEYHPPVVSSKPAHKDGLRWMLQPPPPAKVMEGKVPVSRSTSIASSYAGRKSGSELSLNRRMAREARMRRVDSPNSGSTVKRPRATSSVQRLNSNSISNSISRSVARSRSDSLASSFEDPLTLPLPMPMPVAAPVPGAMASSWSDEDGMLRPSHSANNSANNHRHNNSNNSNHLKLETIQSSNTSTKENTAPETSKAVSAVTTTDKTVLDRLAPVSSSSQDSGLGLTA